jgi:hypothetical protein
MSSSAPLRSSNSYSVSQNSTDWRLNRRITPPLYERSIYRCGRVAIVDIWEHHETDRARRRFFKCKWSTSAVTSPLQSTFLKKNDQSHSYYIFFKFRF